MCRGKSVILGHVQAESVKEPAEESQCQCQWWHQWWCKRLLQQRENYPPGNNKGNIKCHNTNHIGP